MPKPKKIIDTGAATVEALCAALKAKFPQFEFVASGASVVAEGPWDQPANVRPAMGTMASYAEGYLQALIDR